MGLAGGAAGVKSASRLWLTDNSHMQAWLIEFATGVVVSLAGIGLWALPNDTPFIGRPPLFVGWLVIALGLAIVALSIATRFEVQPPLRRKALPPAKQELPRLVRTDSATGPALSAVPVKVPITVPRNSERVYSDATPAELLALGNMPNLTSAERARLLEPHVGKWLQVDGVVEDVDTSYRDQSGFTSVTIDALANSEMARTLASFLSDLDRVARLRKGGRIRVAGTFAGISPMGTALRLNDCELGSASMEPPNPLTPPESKTAVEASTPSAAPTPSTPPEGTTAVEASAPSAGQGPVSRTTINRTPEQLIANFKGVTGVQGRDRVRPYLGHLLRVSGPLEDVHLVSDGIRSATFAGRALGRDFVYANFFDKKWFGRLETLSPGDHLAVIGQIRDIDTLSINLDHCELET